MKKLLLLLPFLAQVGLAGVPMQPTALTLAWNYPTNELSAALTFKVYASTNPAIPLASWPLVATVPGTNLSVTLQVTPGERYYYLTASNLWGESDPSNVVSTPAPPRNDNSLTLRRGP